MPRRTFFNLAFRLLASPLILIRVWLVLRSNLRPLTFESSSVAPRSFPLYLTNVLSRLSGLQRLFKAFLRPLRGLSRPLSFASFLFPFPTSDFVLNGKSGDGGDGNRGECHAEERIIQKPSFSPRIGARSSRQKFPT